MRTFRSCLVLAVFAAATVVSVVNLPASAGAATGTWSEIELRALNPGESTFVEDINNAGTAVGNSGITPVKWDPAGNPTALPIPNGCTQTYVTVINQNGDIAGSSECGTLGFVATIWRPDGTVTTGGSILVSGFNNSDTVAGATSLAEHHAVLQTPGGAAQTLIEGGAGSSFVEDLTNTYLAVGSVTYTDASNRQTRAQAVGWYGPYVFPFLNDTVDNSSAGRANDAGDTIVTISPAAGGSSYAVIVAPGGRVIPLPDGKEDQASDINNAGVAIGTSTTVNGSSASALFAYGSTVVLSDLLSPSAPIDPQHPVAINDSFWIVGHGFTATGGSRLFSWLMRPPS